MRRTVNVRVTKLDRHGGSCLLDGAHHDGGHRQLARNQCEDWVIVEHAFSGSDDTDLVGFADNVFVGRVEERVGSSGPGGPEPWGSTRFSVEVLGNVKRGSAAA